MTAPVAVRGFVADFRASFNRQQKAQRDDITRFVSQFRGVLPKFQTTARTLQKENAPDFNVFTALTIERKEELLHTPMLSYLLDPSSAHGQECLFLRTFFDVCRQKSGFVAPREPLENFRWLVRTEVFVGEDSRIDLMIECPQQQFIIVVENKVDAGEQHKQLRRYFDWMQFHRRDYTFKRLMFLTPDGRQSESAEGVHYTRLSYRKDIRNLLTQALPRITPRPVRNCVEQYLTVVKRLTGETDDAEPDRQENTAIPDAE